MINVLGLSIGMSASMVIFLVVQHDFSFDHFEKNRDRIFRVVSDYSFQGNEGHTRGTQAPLADAVKNEIPGIESVVTFRYFTPVKLAIPGPDPMKPALFHRKDSIIFADEQYFKLIPYKWVAGPQHGYLGNPGEVVLSESRARMYFPSVPFTEIIGRQIVYDDTIPARVTGIVEDVSKLGNTDYIFQEFISLSTILQNNGLRKKMQWDDWGSTTSDQQLYVRLDQHTSVASVNNKLKEVFNKYQGSDAKKNNYTWIYHLQPFDDIHFNPDYGVLAHSVASKPTLYGLMLIAVFLLLLGCINFINLTTAQATQRAKEIGIRKTMGSSRGQLVLQFLTETMMVTLSATGMSMLLTPALLTTFSDFIPPGLPHIWSQPAGVLFLILLVIAITILAGFYPSRVLSSLKTMAVLKNQSQGGKTRRSRMRQTLTVSQFVIAQFFVISTILVIKQIHFMLNTDLGFTKEAILSFHIPQEDTTMIKRNYIVNELQKDPRILRISLASDVPSSWGWWTSTVKYDDGKKKLETAVELKATDSNYIKIFNIPLLAGRFLDPADTVREVLINETYLHILGFKEPVDAIGKVLNWNDKRIPIVGVFRDFHAHPLGNKIGPMIFCTNISAYRQVIVALRPPAMEMAALGSSSRPEWKQAISKMDVTFKKAYPDEAFDYGFFDENIRNAYNSEQHVSSLLEWAMGLMIFVSCLGLLGLVIYVTNNRTREIGIRKVLGATVSNILTILSRDFIKLVVLAFLISTPIAWIAFHAWLQNYQFRTSASWWVFGISGLGMVLIALVTLSLQTVRAAIANPVKSLRTE